jgi:hypothetical protein
MSEDNLLRSIARGDRRASEELYRVYYRRLAPYLATRIPTSHSADEIIAIPSWSYGAVPVSFDTSRRCRPGYLDHLSCCAQVTATQ